MLQSLPSVGSTAAPAEIPVSSPPAAATYSSGRKFAVLAILLLSWILANADRQAMSISIVPIAKEFGLSPEGSGWVLSSFYFSYALMQLGAGWLSDRFSSRRILVFSVACWSILTSLTGVAGTLGVLLLVRLLFGAGEGGFVPASTVTVAEAFPKKERARAKSLVIGASFIGSAIGTSGIAALIHAYGWRMAYHAFGAFGVVVAVAIWFSVKSAPRRPRTAHTASFRTLFASPVLRKTMFVFFFSNIVYVGLISWMPTYLMKTRGIDIVHVGTASAIPYLVAFGALNIVGWLLDKVGQGRERLFMCVGATMVIGFLVTMAFADSLVLLLTFWTLCLVGYTAIYGTVFVIPLKHLPDESVGTAAGIINFGGQVAAAIGPVAIGYLVGATPGSYALALGFLVLAGLGALLVSATWRVSGPAAAHRQEA